MSYFQVLGLSKTCYDVDILKAFRAYSLRWHPQRNKASEAIGKFAEVCEAYQILIDPRFKSVYERLGIEGPRFEGFTPAAPDTVFKGFWRKYGGEDIVQRYLAQGGDSVVEPPDFMPTLEKLEAVQQFSQLYKGEHMPEVNPWRPAPPPSSGSISGVSIREQMMSQWRDKQGMGRQSSAAGRPRNITPAEPWAGPDQGPETQVLMTSPLSPSRDSRITIPFNTRVLITGLQSTPHHNGKTGLVQGATGDRYTVLLDDGSSFNVRTPNLMQMPKVHIVGTEDDGARGVVISFDADTQRYEVQTVHGTMVSLRPANVVLCNNTCVMITGLTDAAQYNGKWGKIVDVDMAAGRYLIKLDERTQIRVRLDNARIATPPLVA